MMKGGRELNLFGYMNQSIKLEYEYEDGEVVVLREIITVVVDNSNFIQKMETKSKPQILQGELNSRHDYYYVTILKKRK